MFRKNLKYFTLGFAVAALGLWATAVGNLTAFQPGTPIKASEVNQNFSLLKDAVAALEASKLTLPFSASANSAANAFQIGNSGNAISGNSSGNGIGVSGASLSGIGVSAYSESGSGLEARSGAGSAVVARAASASCALCVYQGGETSGDLIGGAGPNVRSGFSFRVTATAEVLARNFIVASDRNIKANFRQVDAGEVLEQVAHLPISRWNYKDDPASVAHIGPMAQDFHAAFGLNGAEDKRISAVDAQGVALAAIQGLNQKLEHQVERLKAENAELRSVMADLEARLARLERR